LRRPIGESKEYDRDLRRLADQGASAEAIFMELALDDVGRALETLKDAYGGSQHVDGRVSMEVLASLADDTEGTEQMVRDIWHRVQRPNLMVKIPATEAGIPAIEKMLYEGYSINITLIFGLGFYRKVAEAYVRAMERRYVEGKPLADIGSVASFFVSRVDTKVDKRLDGLVEEGKLQADQARSLKGRAAVANAKLAYEIYQEIFKSERFKKLEQAGASTQRCLWASTSTKNPDYSDVLYVEDLIGPDTVNTLPRKTLDAYVDHGDPASRLEDGLEDAKALISQLEEVGIDMKQVTDDLLDEGVAAFVRDFDKLLEKIRTKAEVVAI